MIQKYVKTKEIRRNKKEHEFILIKDKKLSKPTFFTAEQ